MRAVRPARWAVSLWLGHAFVLIGLSLTNAAFAVTLASGFSYETVVTFTGAGLVTALEVDAAGATIYATATGPTGRLFQAQLAPGQTTAASPVVPGGAGLSVPGDLLWDGATLLLADWNTDGSWGSCCNGRILRFDPAANTLSIVYSPPWPSGSTGDPAHLARGPGGVWGNDLYVLDFQGTSSRAPFLWSVDGAGTRSLVYEDPGVWTTSHKPWYMAFGGPAFGNDLLIADPSELDSTAAGAFGSDVIWRLHKDPVTGAVTIGTLTASLSLVNPRALAIGPGGPWGSDLYVTAQDPLDPGAGALFRVDPLGNATLVAAGLAPHSGALVFSPDGGTLYVAQDGTSVIALTTVVAEPRAAAAALAAAIAVALAARRRAA